MNKKKFPYNTQAQLALLAGKIDEAHDIIGRALAEMTSGACQFAQSYPYDDLPYVVVAMKVAVNALESMLSPNGKALADTIYSRTDSIVVDASEFKRQAKGGTAMSDEICILFGEDGKAHAYNSEFDVTIHCENEREMNDAVALLNLANRLHWRKTDLTPPTEEDADEHGKVLAIEKCGAFEGAVETWDFDTVAQFPDQYPIWMPLPKLPEVEE